MTLEKDITEITEKQFRSLDFSTIDAASILGMSEAEIIQKYGSREGYPITFPELMAYGRKIGIKPEQIKENILKTCNCKIISDNKEEKKKKYIQGKLF